MTHLLRAACRARDGRRRGEAGFTLVEVMVSIVILVLAVAALLTTLVVALQGTVLGRANQQAGDVANAEIERIRSFSYPQVTLASGDSTLLSAPTYEGEPVAVALGGAVQPALTTFVADNRTYSVRRWVTDAETNAAGEVTVRRVTVEVSFEANGRDHVRTASTLVTNTRRGLPLPIFRFDYNGAAPLVSGRWKVTVAPSADADFGLVLRNLGARDTWNITSSQGGWAFHLDTNQNGVLDTGEPALTDTDGDGVPDTAPIEPSTAPLYLVANRAIGSAESGLSDITFTATSSAQPAGGVKVVQTTMDVTTGAATPTPAPSPPSSSEPCTGGTPVLANSSVLPPSWTGGGYSTLTLTLQNGDTGDSTSRNPMSLSRDSTTQTGTCNFSTELQTGVAGRVLLPLVPAAWDYTPTGGGAKDKDYRGTGVLKVWVKCTTGTTPTLTATFGRKADLVHTATGSVTVAASACNSAKFSAVGIQVPNATFDSNGDPVQVRLRSSQVVAVLYDAPDAGAYFAVGAK